MGIIEEALEQQTRKKAEDPAAARHSPGLTDAQQIVVDDVEEDILEPAELADRKIISPGMADRVVEDSFIALRTETLRRCAGQSCAIAVIPCCDHSGGSFVARNLAAAFASDEYMRSTLIDCNLRDPDSSHNLLDGDAFGLSDYLFGGTNNLEKIIYPVGIERMRLIPAGSRRRLRRDFLTTARFQRFMHSVRAHYEDRYLVFDAPPILDSSDSRILADLSDFVVLVAGYGASSRQDVEQSIEMINHAKLVGVVLNRETKLPLRVGKRI